MSRQDKATTERFTRTLRELVKRPENKLCADCKRNDPRWASWNIGVFLCIRCSGIHRGMGTHISKVKSVDLDTWTPEQMESIQKWGNHLANLYWEAHLKPGHIPPEHKMESFIRSKYESRRWALEGPPPTNPSDLEANSQTRLPSAQPEQHSAALRSSETHTSTASVSTRTAPVNSQPQAHRLLSSNYAVNSSKVTPVQPTTIPTPAPAPQQPQQPKTLENDLFSLDFHAPASPAPAVPEPPKKDVKQDILSLFSSAPPAAVPVTSTFGQFESVPAAMSWATVPPQATSMLGTSGVGAWGASSGWKAPVAAQSAQGNPWASGAGAGAVGQQQHAGLVNTAAVWGSPPASSAAQDPFSLFAGASSTASSQPKKDDVFGDLWGGFK